MNEENEEFLKIIKSNLKQAFNESRETKLVENKGMYYTEPVYNTFEDWYNKNNNK